ncbi:MAG TPA: TIGR03668 family PPOX class F420-dependent oxidoreductase [Candidatus Dormibacteraeota bacterium]|nr:TIGR03668 family PPOX class F420-dependent oxidoreductase [Candidatus Dormibacteraeota bacterium]
MRRQVTRARVGHFASSDGERPALVPVCFVLLGATLYHAIDAKPKAREPRRLQRVLNIRANQNAALLVDHYEEDWRRLWYALFRGTARILESGTEHERAIRALRRKYRQYRTTVPLDDGALVIALDAQRLSHWQSSSPGRDRARRRDRRA